jgi:hypothetical protein
MLSGRLVGVRVRPAGRWATVWFCPSYQMIQPELSRYLPVRCDGRIDDSACQLVGKTSSGAVASGNDLGKLALVTRLVQPETQRCPSVTRWPAEALICRGSRLKVV